MKNSLIITGLFAALTSGAFAQTPPAPKAAEKVTSPSADILSVGLTPKQKKALTVEPDELNPFAIILDEAVETETYEDISAQEQKIRGVFKSLGVSGVTKSGTGYKVLIGDMILREGQVVPFVIPDQTETLEVLSINEEEMVIGWMEEQDTRNSRRRKADTGRQLTIPISRGVSMTPKLPRAVSGASNSRSRR